MNKTLLYIVLFLAAAVVGFSATYFLRRDSGEQAAQSGKVVAAVSVPEVNTPEIVLSDKEAPKAEILETENPVKKEPAPEKPVVTEPEFEIVLSGKKTEAIGEGRFRVSGIRTKGGSGGTVKFTLTDSEGHSYESLDGTFPEVQSNTRGNYVLKATDLSTGKTANARHLYGFKIVKSVEGMSAAELSALFNTGNGDNLTKVSHRIVTKPKVTCNLPDVTTFSAVFTKVWMEGLHADVTHVTYDATGKVSAITVNLQ